MKNEKQIKKLMNEIIKDKPFGVFDKINKNSQGVNSVLSYLLELGRPATAGEIANKLEVSTARVAVLMKKLIKNKYIIKYTNSMDQRITMIELTDSGRDYIIKEKDSVTDFFKKIVDEIGVTDTKALIRICNKLKKM